MAGAAYDEFVVMLNHVHGVILLNDDNGQNLNHPAQLHLNFSIVTVIALDV